MGNELKKFQTGLAALPDEAFSRLRTLQPEAGCGNACSFCSQMASPTRTAITRQGLDILFSAIRKRTGHHKRPSGETLANESTSSSFYITQRRTEHRPGVIYPYLDNDVGTYKHLATYIDLSYRLLGTRVRLSTVGYSRLNRRLQKMHQTINKSLLNHIAGVRFSFTPYTRGWLQSSEKNGSFSRESFLLDFANLLRTYLPAICASGFGDRQACVELRFRPKVSLGEVDECLVDGHHVIRSPPILLVGTKPHRFPARASIDGTERHRLRLSREPTDYWLVTSDSATASESFRRVATRLLKAGSLPNEMRNSSRLRSARVILTSNGDGCYFAIDPVRSDTGGFSKEIYPLTKGRPKSGHIDSERYFLNALLRYKKEEASLPSSSPWGTATWDNVAHLLDNLRRDGEDLAGADKAASNYIATEILPLVSGYARALYKAGLGAPLFFHPKFTIDTGSICNLGRAHHEYRGIASRPQMTVTPQHERAYGKRSSLAREGIVWRIRPQSGARLHLGTSDPKPHQFLASGYLLVEEVDLAATSSPDEGVRRKFSVPFPWLAVRRSLQVTTPELPGALPAGERVLPLVKSGDFDRLFTALS